MRAVLVVFAALAVMNASAMGVDRDDADVELELDAADADAFVAVEDEVFDTRVFAHGAAEDESAPLPPPDGDPRGTGYNEETAKKAADYSSAAYYKGDPAAALDWKGNHQTNNFQDSKVFTAQMGKGKKATEVSGYAGYDAKENKIVVAYRGTGSAREGDGKMNGAGGSKQLLQEVKQGLVGHTVGRNGAKSSKYFGKATDKLHDAGLQQHIEDLRAQHPNADMMVTGHSLGGAMAQNGAMKMKHTGVFDAKPNPNAGGADQKRVTPDVYTFGQPKTGNKAFNKQYNKAIPNHFRVQHAQDVVPKTGRTTGGSSAGHKVRYEGGMADGQFKVTPQGQTSKSGDLTGAIGKQIKADASNAVKDATPTAAGAKRNPLKTLGKAALGAGKVMASPVTGTAKAMQSGVKQHSEYFGPMGSQFKNHDAQIKAHAEGVKAGTNPQGFQKGVTQPDPKAPKAPKAPKQPKQPKQPKAPKGLPHAPEATGIGRKGKPGPKPKSAGAGARADSKPKAGAKPKPAAKPKATKTPRTPRTPRASRGARKPATRPRRF